jgi:hypothetical protein
MPRSAAADRVIVVGDIHADVDALLLNLFLAGMINKTGGWTGEKAVVVQLGDQIDGKRFVEVPGECPELRVLQYVEHLKTEARNAGGDVVSLLGNHEMIWMTQHESARIYLPFVTASDLSWFTPSAGPGATDEEKEQVENIQYSERQTLFAAGSGPLATKIMAGRGVCLQIGRWMFSHGDTISFLKKYPPLARSVGDLNNFSYEYLMTGRIRSSSPRSEMLKLLTIGAIDHNTYETVLAAEAHVQAQAQAAGTAAAETAAAETAETTETTETAAAETAETAERPPKQQRLEGGSVGPLWDRGVCEPEKCLEDMPPSLLQHHGFVSSHSVQSNFSINSYCADRVWCVDTGRSLSFASSPRVLDFYRFLFQAARAEVLEIIHPNSPTPDLVVHRFAAPDGMFKTISGIF